MNERRCDTHYTGFRHKASCRGETVPLAISSTGGAAGVALGWGKAQTKEWNGECEYTAEGPGTKQSMVLVDSEWGSFN